MRADDGREPRLKGGDDIGGVIDAERGLSDIGQTSLITHGDTGHIVGRFDQQHIAIGQLAHGADRFGVACVADHDDLQACIGMALRLDMDLGDQRAGGIDIDHIARLRRRGHGFRHAMGGKDHRTVVGAFRQFLDKDRALVAQPVDDEFIVHDLMAHIDWGAPFLEGHLNDLDRPVHARAESARRGEVEGQGRVGHAKSPNGLAQR